MKKKSESPSARDRRRKQHENYKANIGRLISLFPEVFDRNNPKPLAIGTAEMLLSVPSLGLDDDLVSDVLSCWCSRREYIRSAHEMRERWNIANVPVGPIIDWQQKRFDRIYHSMMRRGYYN